MATDYSTGCGGVALKWLQMLASTIVGYHDIAGLLHYRLNAVGEADDCEELSDFLDCDTSHIEPERQLVENTFALDDCSILAMKVYASHETVITDYSECGEIPKTLIEMLARCIVNYDGHNMINCLIDGDDCEHITTLLNCTTNSIESERLLVQNLFATDSCDRLGLKIFVNTSESTDYHTECTEAPESFIELLARCIVLYDGHYWLNSLVAGDDCEDLHAFWTCSNNHIDPERALAENIFATDSCGNLGVKWFGDAVTSRGGGQ